DILDDMGTLTAHIESPLDQSPTPCADGRFQGLRNKEWILFDSNGRALAPPEGRLDFANCDARLRVHVGGRGGVVDAAMQWILPPRFEAITRFPVGKAACSPGSTASRASWEQMAPGSSRRSTTT